jgi:hypothetical protein
MRLSVAAYSHTHLRPIVAASSGCASISSIPLCHSQPSRRVEVEVAQCAEPRSAWLGHGGHGTQETVRLFG